LREIGTYMEPVRLSKADRENYVHPGYAIGLLSEMADPDAILVADVGQNQIWTARHYQVTGKRQFMTSGGLGTMGYGVSASLGAKLASPEKQVIAVTGDGGLLMLLGELGTIAESGHAVTILLMNNQRLGMVRELQDNTYGRGRQYAVCMENRPDFVMIAKAFGLAGRRVEREEDLPQALSEALKSNVPYLLEVMIDPEAATL
jgi:acetolactate synthase-1/2/3 large subunit